MIVERSYVEAAGATSTAAAKEVLSSMSASIKHWEMVGMFLVTTGGGVGLLSFGPICERLGRRATFFLFQAGGLVTALIVFQGMANASAGALCWMLPVFGFTTLGLHAGVVEQECMRVGWDFAATHGDGV